MAVPVVNTENQSHRKEPKTKWGTNKGSISCGRKKILIANTTNIEQFPWVDPFGITVILDSPC